MQICLKKVGENFAVSKTSCNFALAFGFYPTATNMVAIVQLVRASDCGSECRRFESD